MAHAKGAVIARVSVPDTRVNHTSTACPSRRQMNVLLRRAGEVRRAAPIERRRYSGSRATRPPACFGIIQSFWNQASAVSKRPWRVVGAARRLKDSFGGEHAGALHPAVIPSPKRVKSDGHPPGAAGAALCHGFRGCGNINWLGVGSDRRPVNPPILQAIPMSSRTFGVGSPDWVLKHSQTAVKPSCHSNDQE